jgi:hypothetical protein
VTGLSVESDVTFTYDQLVIFPYWQIRTAATPDGWFPVVAMDDPTGGGGFIGKLKKGEKATMTIESFSKGGN